MSQEKVVLIVGSCNMDRLLTVSKYPDADSKVRTTSYHQMGGGNAANTAAAMAMLSDASFLRDSNIRIKLLTKIGDDYTGQQLTDELAQSGVDVSSPLYRVGPPGSITPFTTIIVSESEFTRTCIHTYGSCGELKPEDVESVDMDEVFANVVHLHCDSRHTAGALALAQEARRRNLPVSVDVEKDRHNHSCDHLLELATMIFTNSQQLKDYLARRTKEMEVHLERNTLPDPIVLPGSRFRPDDPLVDGYARAIQPTFFFERLGTPEQKRKELVITKGSLGALHIRCTKNETESFMEGGETDKSYQEMVVEKVDGTSTVQVDHTVNEHTWGTMYQEMKLKYTICSAGVIPKPLIIDTTGAGDAFIGAFLLIKLGSDAKSTSDVTQVGLHFGCWVACNKLSGPGARAALPKGATVDEKLGRTFREVQESLKKTLLPFGKPESNIGVD